ncbi:MAG: YjbQ family protein [Nitrospirae bacterium YQR-1]
MKKDGVYLTLTVYFCEFDGLRRIKVAVKIIEG